MNRVLHADFKTSIAGHFVQEAEDKTALMTVCGKMVTMIIHAKVDIRMTSGGLIRLSSNFHARLSTRIERRWLYSSSAGYIETKNMLDIL